MIHPRPTSLFICLFFHCFPLLAQEWDIRTYTTLDGLCDNAISSFYEDQFGYFWIGTGRGLNRFDGVNFRKYGTRNGMPSMTANCIFEDHKGRMWIGARRGMAEFRNDSFYVFPNTDRVQITHVFQIYENPDEQVIANTLEGQYAFQGSQWEPYSSVPLLKDDIIVSAIQTEEGEYFSTGYEIIYKKRNGSVKTLWKHPNDFPYFRDLLYFDKELFVVANSRLYKIDSVHQELMFPNELKDKSILTYFKDSNDRWWLSTRQDGILMLENRDGQITVRQLPGPSDFAAAYHEDREKQMWIGSPNGVMKILPSTFSAIKIHEVEAGQHILNIIPYGDRQFLISINDGRLLHISYDINGTSIYNVLNTYLLDGNRDFVDEYAVGISGEMWLTTRTCQLYLLRNNALVNKSHLITDAGQQLAFDVACDPVSGQIIVAMDSLLAIGNENQLDTLFADDHTSLQLPRQIVFMEGDHLVVQASGNEVFIYTRGEGKQERFSRMQLHSTASRDIKSDQSKQLWIYEGGEHISCFKYNHQSGVVPEEVIDETTDNISMQFYHFTFDHEGSIWSITNRGIQQIYKDGNLPWQSREQVIYEISHSAYVDWFKIVESGNKIWVNLQNQLIYFDRAIPEHPGKSAVVILEEVQLNNRTTSWENHADSLSGYFQIPVGLELRHDQNTLTFVYNSPATVENRGTSYSYRLLPGDGIWSNPSANTSVSFSKLKPDHYTFQVRSRNSGIEWSDATLFSFDIQKPFWDTIWFRFLLLLMVSSVVVWIFRIRLRQERAKGEMKSQLLELEMRALRAQMNPHFIFNALNSIQSLVATNQSASANKYISKFARLLRQVLENSRKSEVTLKQELESLRLYVQLEQLRMDSEVDFVENIDDFVIPELVHIPPMILQPFVENALWHGLSDKEGEKKIELNITADADWIYFIITDNGIGRQAAEARKAQQGTHTSTGMEVTEQRLRDFNGQTVLAPVKIQDLIEDHKPSGTRVILQIRKKHTPAASV